MGVFILPLADCPCVCVCVPPPHTTTHHHTPGLRTTASWVRPSRAWQGGCPHCSSTGRWGVLRVGGGVGEGLLGWGWVAALLGQVYGLEGVTTLPVLGWCLP